MKYWPKVKTSPTEAFLSVTAKLASRTVDTNRLTLQVLNLTYLPRRTPGQQCQPDDDAAFETVTLGWLGAFVDVITETTDVNAYK